MGYTPSMTLLSSKLTPPVGSHILDRERLMDIIVEPAHTEPAKLIQIIAGAGFGKTTLAAQAMARFPKATPIWYRLDEFDRDLSIFMAYLTRAVEKQIPKAIFPPYPEPALAPNAQKRWLIEWLTALETALASPLFMVLDDYHRVDRALNPVVEFILDRLPPGSTLVLASRREPGLKISRLRAARRITDIQERDLAFTPREIQFFFQDQPPLSPPEMARIQDATDGWAAGLVLFQCAMHQSAWSGDFKKSMEALPPSKEQIFTYLEENIFEHQPKERQSFMVKTALLSTLDPHFCNRVLGIQNAQKIFQAMVADHLMVFPLAGATPGFHYHHLLRDFLRTLAPTFLGDRSIRKLHLKAADILAKENHPLALHHAIEARAYARAAQMLSTLEVQFLLKGQMPFVKECLDRIPDSVSKTHPQILFMAAKQDSYYGKPARAIEHLEQAHVLFREKKDKEGCVKCLADLGAQYYYTGHLPRAKETMEAVLPRVESASPTYILLMTYLIFFAAALGKIRESEAHETSAQKIIQSYPPFEKETAQILLATSKAYRLYITGEMEAANRLNEWLIQKASETQLAACLPLARYQGAATCYYLRDYKAGLDHALKGIKTATHIHLRDSQKAWLHLARAENLMGLAQGDKTSWQEVEIQARKGLEIFQGPDNCWGMAHGHNILAKIAMKQGNIPLAHTRLDNALACIRGRGLDFPEAQIKLTRARLWAMEKKWEEAQALIVRLLPPLKPAAHLMGLAKGLLLHCQGKRDRSRQMEGPSPGQGAGWENWAAQKLAEIKKSNGKIPGTQGPKNDAPNLDIQLLGPFTLHLGNLELQSQDWNHSKALELFQYLAAHLDKGYIPKDRLLEILWPDQDPAKTGKRFNTAASYLRKRLEPDLVPKAPSAYLLRKKDGYRLNPGPLGKCDLTDFFSHARAASQTRDPDKAAAHARDAEALYKGVFLEENPYSNWRIQVQESLDRTRSSLLKRLLAHSRDAGNLEAALEWTRTALELDPHDESLYQDLMEIYAAQGRYAKVRDAFEAYKHHMAAMDCPLSPKIQTTFTRLGP